ncbi:MAG: GGDEF domain-containing protein [Vicinamibacterales bacterium]
MTELGLRTSVEVAPPPPPPPPDAPAMVADVSMPATETIELAEPGTPPADQRGEFLLTFLDKLMDVLAQLAPDSDAGQLEGFRERIQAYRQMLGTSQVSGLPIIAEDCVATCRRYLEGAKTYRGEREKELAEVISILQEAAKLTVGDSSDFNAQVLATSERFTALAGLDDIREMRRRIGDEVGSLKRAVEEKQRRDESAYTQLTSRVETLQKKLSDMEVEATMDPLTCVGNRRRFQLSLTRMVAHAKQTNTPLSLAMVDVDHFKAINDKHGHPIGDRVLLLVAQKLAKAVRQTDIVARYGGEEFAMLLANVSARDVEARLKQLLIDIGSSAYEYDSLGKKEKVSFTVSCGLADYNQDEAEDDFVKRADEALYEAKRKGRNRLIARRRSIIGKVLSWG